MLLLGTISFPRNDVCIVRDDQLVKVFAVDFGLMVK